jgi:hypothetical protein
MSIYVCSNLVRSRKENLRDAVLHCISKNERTRPGTFWIEFEGERFKPSELGFEVTLGDIIMAALGAEPKNEREYEAIYMKNAKRILAKHGFRDNFEPESDLFQTMEEAERYLGELSTVG